MKDKPCQHDYTRHLHKEDGYYRQKYKCSKCRREYLSKLKIPVKNDINYKVADIIDDKEETN